MKFYVILSTQKKLYLNFNYYFSNYSKQGLIKGQEISEEMFLISVEIFEMYRFSNLNIFKI